MVLTLGSRLGQYEIVAALGAGGMGEVYRARDTKLGRDVAIKILPDAAAKDPERIARFHREAQALAALNDPHIAHIHGIDESVGTTALVMEFVDGPTLADLHATYAGVILGTAAYMSPEQARGKPVDRRTDVWAFGCVLYEMLTGRQAFEAGETVSDAIAAVLKNDPDWSALPSSVPDQIRVLLKRCLERDRLARISDMGTVRFLLTETLGAAASSTVPRPFARAALTAAGGMLAGALLAAGSALWWSRANVAPGPEPIRFELLVPLFGRNLGGALGGTRQVAISPDGHSVAFISGAGGPANQLIVRHLNQLETTTLVTTAAPVGPFFSPDGKWIGYFAASAGELRKVPVSGGPPVTVCSIPVPPRGGTWGPDHTIVFGLLDSAGGLRSVPDGGGEVKMLTRPDVKAGDVLIRGGASPQYVSTGHLLYATASGDLRAVRFDPKRLEIVGEVVQVASHVLTIGGGSQFAVSRTGTLTYVPGESAASPSTGTRSIVWVDRSGREEAIPGAPPRGYAWSRLSPDGTKAALDIRDQNQDVWIFDFARRVLTRVTFDPMTDGFPVWTPDGSQIVFESNRTGVFNAYRQRADGTGSPEALTHGNSQVWPNAMSPDGRTLLLQTSSPTTGSDLATLALDGKSLPVPLLHTQATETNADISPDGRWLAYQSNESGNDEVYVRPFPDVGGGRWQVSSGGGRIPAWSPTGRELFYLAAQTLMAVPVRTSPTFTFENAERLFDVPDAPSVPPMRYYDVSRDGRRFLLIKDPPASSDAAPSKIVVTLNWAEELKAKAAR